MRKFLQFAKLSLALSCSGSFAMENLDKGFTEPEISAKKYNKWIRLGKKMPSASGKNLPKTIARATINWLLKRETLSNEEKEYLQNIKKDRSNFDKIGTESNFQSFMGALCEQLGRYFSRELLDALQWETVIENLRKTKVAICNDDFIPFCETNRGNIESFLCFPLEKKTILESVISTLWNEKNLPLLGFDENIQTWILERLSDKPITPEVLWEILEEYTKEYKNDLLRGKSLTFIYGSILEGGNPLKPKQSFEALLNASNDLNEYEKIHCLSQCGREELAKFFLINPGKKDNSIAPFSNDEEAQKHQGFQLDSKSKISKAFQEPHRKDMMKNMMEDSSKGILEEKDPCRIDSEEYSTRNNEIPQILSPDAFLNKTPQGNLEGNSQNQDTKIGTEHREFDFSFWGLAGNNASKGSPFFIGKPYNAQEQIPQGLQIAPESEEISGTPHHKEYASGNPGFSLDTINRMGRVSTEQKTPIYADSNSFYGGWAGNKVFQMLFPLNGPFPVFFPSNPFSRFFAPTSQNIGYIPLPTEFPNVETTQPSQTKVSLLRVTNEFIEKPYISYGKNKMKGLKPNCNKLSPASKKVSKVSKGSETHPLKNFAKNSFCAILSAIMEFEEKVISQDQKNLVASIRSKISMKNNASPKKIKELLDGADSAFLNPLIRKVVTEKDGELFKKALNDSRIRSQDVKDATIAKRSAVIHILNNGKLPKNFFTEK